MGIKLDEEKNRNLGTISSHYAIISADDSPVTILVVANNDERLVAWETLRAIERNQLLVAMKEDPTAAPIPVEISAHHVHLSQADVEKLFGPGHQLTPEHELSQPGKFACAEKVHLVGPKGRIANVRVLGPTRKETQVEIAMTEQFKVGIQPPIRQSGDLVNTPGITLEGPYGTSVIERGVICAQRHIHMTPEDAMRFRVRDNYVVRVRVEGERELIFGDVVVRVNPGFRLAMHIDTDEGNAANITYRHARLHRGNSEPSLSALHAIPAAAGMATDQLSGSALIPLQRRCSACSSVKISLKSSSTATSEHTLLLRSIASG
jgi:acetate kinase